MVVSCFAYPSAADLFATGILSGCKTKEGAVSITFRKTGKIAGFHNKRKGCMGPDSKETNQVFDFFLIFGLFSEFIDPRMQYELTEEVAASTTRHLIC